MHRVMVLAFVLSVAVSVQAQTVELRYSGVYDEVKHRQHFSTYPSEAEIAARVAHVEELWEREQENVRSRIKKAASVDFPKNDLVVYLVGGGRGISDPLTVALYANQSGDPEKPKWEPQTDEWFLHDLTHELLHHVAKLPEYEMLRRRLHRAFPGEESVAFNHILVAAFETRIYGYSRVAGVYTKPEYARALFLAKDFGLTTEQPLP